MHDTKVDAIPSSKVKGVARADSLCIASSLASARQPFILSHDLRDRLPWHHAEELLDCPHAQAATWHALVSPDGIVGHYDRRKWAVEARQLHGHPASLHWRNTSSDTASVAIKARPPRHVCTPLPDGSLQDLWPLWTGLAAPPIELGVPRPFVYLRGTLSAEPASALMSGSVFEQLRASGQFGLSDFGVTLYASPAGAQTNLHVDEHSGFLVQITGRKRVVLFNKSTARSLRCETWGHEHEPISRRSWFDDGVPNGWMDAHPFKGLEGREVEVGPGDALYIPHGWFHDVRSEDVETLGVVLRCRN
eukprot:gnl/TRDRNA2_/TRDRNA2_194384_c0_seq1.p1 gnl/TRDRNA2_/TRDRNA2_194384_c0~~gnl/TRDRNA2_/TRDRNA2_194384_c0_seq1.p1  ORF type:complete len:354 (-),score=31.68 gnl/TRDRNA2_/TRDRNA2_194384_c0_seq1:129-1043(-)